jgi:hypothetical protein
MRKLIFRFLLFASQAFGAFTYIAGTGGGDALT